MPNPNNNNNNWKGVTFGAPPPPRKADREKAEKDDSRLDSLLRQSTRQTLKRKARYGNDGGTASAADDDNGRRRSKGGGGSDRSPNSKGVVDLAAILSDKAVVSIRDLASLLGGEDKTSSVLKFLLVRCGVMATINMSVDRATAKAVVEGLGFECLEDVEAEARIAEEQDDGNDDDVQQEVQMFENFDDENKAPEDVLRQGLALLDDPPESQVKRPCVVTVMGHVDHGKTTLLDALRSTSVTSTEAGGITQAIGAYAVVTSTGDSITFIDTPGHAAFQDMRSRGANVTDVVVLVVAADDGVMAQTADAINCARRAGVPIVVAINKIDAEGADSLKVQAALTEYGVLTETLGGKLLVADISAKNKVGLDDLLSKILLQAEFLDLKANPNRFAVGVVLDARVERGLGPVATTLVQKGTLRVGDAFVAGEASGRVKALLVDAGGKRRRKVDEVGPSTPVYVVGLSAVPSPGDLLIVAEDELKARQIAEMRRTLTRESVGQSFQTGLMESISDMFNTDVKKKARKEMHVVIKADVQGMSEALARSLGSLRLSDAEGVVTVNVLLADVGAVTKGDVAMASVKKGTTIVAFNVASNPFAAEEARMRGVDIEYFDVVYDAIAKIEGRMQQVLSPTPEGEYIGKAEVMQVFKIGGTGNVAGAKVVFGKMSKDANVRIMRGDKILSITTKMKSMRHLKSEFESLDAGMECGIALKDFEDFEKGDFIECYLPLDKK